MGWPRIPEVEAKLVRLLAAIRDRAPGEPFDGTERCIDVGELMWRGLLEPCADHQADVVVQAQGVHLAFALTARGRSVERP